MVPENLRYMLTHEWCLVKGDVATIGVTEYALDSLGAVISVELPEPGEDVLHEVPFGEMEGIEGEKELISPFDGRVEEVNVRVVYDPDLLENDPYGEGWIMRLKLIKQQTPDQLLSAAEYEQAVKRRR